MNKLYYRSSMNIDRQRQDFRVSISYRWKLPGVGWRKMLHKGRPTSCSLPGSWREKCGGRTKKRMMYSRLLWPPRRAVLKKCWVISSVGVVQCGGQPSRRSIYRDTALLTQWPVLKYDTDHLYFVMAGMVRSPAMTTWQDLAQKTSKKKKLNINSHHKWLPWHWDNDLLFFFFMCKASWTGASGASASVKSLT